MYTLYPRQRRFAERMTIIKPPPSPLIIKVVSACSAFCKHPRMRPEVQRLFSLLYPGYNTTNQKETRTERTIEREQEKCKSDTFPPSGSLLRSAAEQKKQVVAFVQRQRLRPAEEELIRETLLTWKGSVRTSHEGGVEGRKQNGSSVRARELGSSSEHSG